MKYFNSHMSNSISMVVHSGERQQLMLEHAGKVAYNLCDPVNYSTFQAVKFKNVSLVN